MASVVGRRFDEAALGALATWEGEARGHLEPALEAGIIGEVEARPQVYEFTHALIRETLYDEIAAHEKTRLHHRLAAAIESSAGADLDGREEN